MNDALAKALRARGASLPWGNDSETTQVLLVRAADTIDALDAALRQCKIVLECLSSEHLVEQRMAALASARAALGNGPKQVVDGDGT